MKFKYLLALCLLFACSKKNDPQDQNYDLAALQKQRDGLVASFSETEIARCDRLTFVAMMDAFGKPMDLHRYEYPRGVWHRDVNPCYPTDSKSECSQDGYISVLHSLLSHKDLASIKAIKSSLQSTNWICGAGDINLTLMPQLGPILDDMISALDPTKKARAQKLGKIVIPPIEINLSGFRGHVLDNYAWLWGRIHGRMTIAGLVALKLTADQNEGAPYPLALFHRFSDQDYNLAVQELLDMKDCSAWWGSCNNAVYWTMVLAVIEGK